MRHLLLALLLVIPQFARADAFDRVPENAAFYATVRPAALLGALKKAGIDSLPAVQRVRQSTNVDVLDPALLAPSGLDAAAPIGASLVVQKPSGALALRIVATLRDPTMFRVFVGAIAAAKQAPIKIVDAASPAGQLGVLATAELPDSGLAIARIEGDALIVDAVEAMGGKMPSAVEIAKKTPLKVASAVRLEKGARRLFAPDTAAALYLDGRRYGELLTAIGRVDLADELKRTPKAKRAALKQKRLKTLAGCAAEWERAPSTFDDLGLALSADPGELRLTLAWGTQGGVPLGGLQFAPSDDEGLDAEFLARTAPIMGALFAASTAPFAALKRGGVYQSVDSLSSFSKRCGDAVNVGMFVRGWPLAIGAALAEANKASSNQPAAGGFDLSGLMKTFGQLRNVLVVVRDANEKSAQFAVAATLDAQARVFLEGLLAVLGTTGAPKPIGKRTPTVYTVSIPMLGGSWVASLETLTRGPLLLTVADSEESLQFAYRVPTLMPGSKAPPRPVTPIASAHVDAALISRYVSNNARGDVRAAIDMLSRLRRFDADLVADGDLFRLMVRAPLK